MWGCSNDVIEVEILEDVKKCVAAGCSNEPSQQVSLLKLPRDLALRKEWTRQVQS